MQTRRDHLHAYQFATGRLASALISADPGNGDTPLRKAGLGAVFGVLLAVLLVLGAAVYGFLKPAPDNHAWATNGALIVENGTGTRYFYADGQLHPTANYASALLASNGADVRAVDRAALADVPRGATLGIPGAPEDVPGPSALLTGSWTDCLRPGAHVGETLDFAPGTVHALTGSTHVLVAGPDGKRYVLAHNTKYPIDDRSAVLALGMDTDRPVLATRAWLDALPTGPAIAAARISGAGGAGRTVAGRPRKVGALLRTVVSGADHYYVLESDGVASLTATESALLSAAGSGEPLQVDSGVIAALPSSADTSLLHRIPDLLAGNDATGGHSALCLRQYMKGSERHSSLVRESGRAAATTAAVLLRPEAGVLATSPKGPHDTQSPTPYLITDRAVKYPLSSDALGALGYSGQTPRVLPRAVLDQITTGPGLSRSKALVAVPGVN
ncbi:type VII secretion protein EccB [Streptomyces sp. 8L]|uniref:type VII secretion protein EccB n=1 Tax=Streptomyces sp. 8L TaxID=2877242 RepID=UPI001CD77CB3|nr:type VII secretion protein EccB [Streptomyces sp. 8L]MCA1217011.1 type VII secretion protein EccB [Streptomyces sp. 8L]